MRTAGAGGALVESGSGDHVRGSWVVEEGVTQTGQEVTRIVAENFRQRQRLRFHHVQGGGNRRVPCGYGMNCGTVGGRKLGAFLLIRQQGGPREPESFQGTGHEPFGMRDGGLRRDSVWQGALKEKGYGILLAGEMGIGNTTPASILASLLTGLPLEKAIGRGAGLSDEGLEKKKRAAERAVRRFASRYPKLMGRSWRRQENQKRGGERSGDSSAFGAWRL